jgi:DNA-binding NarL/FixJ family response regulator
MARRFVRQRQDTRGRRRKWLLLSPRIRILIVDDHPAVRYGLVQLIAAEPDLEVCGEAADKDEVLEAISRRVPDFIVLDISLKDKSATGLDLISQIHKAVGPVPVLIYSMHDEALYARRALRAGARGYLMKQEPVRQVITAIRSILAGDIYVSEEIRQGCRLGTGESGADALPDSRIALLSPRELTVFQHIGQGMQPREIAAEMFLTVKTVETHRWNIRKKLGLANAAELTRFAVAWMHRL